MQTSLGMAGFKLFLYQRAEGNKYVTFRKW